MSFRKYFAGASAMLMIFANSPQIFADEIEVFGEEFEQPQETPPPQENSQPVEVVTPPEEVSQPAEVVTPPEEVSQPAEVVTPPEEVSQPVEVVTPPEEVSQPAEVVTPPEEISQPVEVVTPPEEVSQPVEVVTPPEEVSRPVEVVTPPEEISRPVEVVTPPEEVSQPVEVVTPPEEVSQPFEQNNLSEDEDFGDTLNFDNGEQQNPEIFTPPANNEPTRPDNRGTIEVITPSENNPPRSNGQTTPQASPKQSKLKTLPQRFVKIAIDENYIYYLDKKSVTWKKIPYMTSEYMADVWIRMIERDTDTSDLPSDMAAYINDTSSDEIALAKDQGYQYMPEDQKVLQHKKYFMEHYYLRPKTDQIQFLCELEVIGHPQNTASQRKYDYNNWEELIPGSIESILYYSTIQIIGKGKASERGHMTFADMVEEYGRISIR